jgi:hypothetical protein
MLHFRRRGKNKAYREGNNVVDKCVSWAWARQHLRHAVPTSKGGEM